VAAGAVVVIAGWVFLELRSAHPLIELRLVRRIGVLTADMTGVLTGVGMYLFISVLTRWVQTPSSTGYGPGGSVVMAGLMLIPFSAGSLAASRITQVLARRMPQGRILPLAAVVLLGAMVMFALTRGGLWEIAVTMGVVGVGIGAIFAVMPGFITSSVPPQERGSALSFNQVLRYLGFGLGSSLSAVILQAYTAPGHVLPVSSGYTATAVFACAVWAVTVAVSLILPRFSARPADSLTPSEDGAQRVGEGADAASPTAGSCVGLRSGLADGGPSASSGRDEGMG